MDSFRGNRTDVRRQAERLSLAKAAHVELPGRPAPPQQLRQPRHHLLALLDEARRVKDMDAPGLRLHTLKGDRKGLWAVTVQANWRIVFRFEDGNAYVVDYLDYH